MPMRLPSHRSLSKKGEAHLRIAGGPHDASAFSPEAKRARYRLPDTCAGSRDMARPPCQNPTRGFWRAAISRPTDRPPGPVEFFFSYPAKPVS